MKMQVEGGGFPLPVIATSDLIIEINESEFEADRLPLVMVRVTDSKGRKAAAFLSAVPTARGIEFRLNAKVKDNFEQVARTATATYALPRVVSP